MAFGKFVATNLFLILCLLAVLSVAAPRKGLSRKVLRAGNEIGSSTISKITLPSSSALRKARSSGATNIRASLNLRDSSSSSGDCDFCQFCNTWDADQKYKNFATKEACEAKECICETLQAKTVGANLNDTSVCIWPVVPKPKGDAIGNKTKTHLCMDTALLIEAGVGSGTPESCQMSICRGASDGNRAGCSFSTVNDACFIQQNGATTEVCFTRELHSSVWKEDWWRVFRVKWTDTGCETTLNTFISIPHSDRLFQSGQCGSMGEGIRQYSAPPPPAPVAP